jgi:hypothetical protein
MTWSSAGPAPGGLPSNQTRAAFMDLGHRGHNGQASCRDEFRSDIAGHVLTMSPKACKARQQKLSISTRPARNCRAAFSSANSCCFWAGRTIGDALARQFALPFLQMADHERKEHIPEERRCIPSGRHLMVSGVLRPIALVGPSCCHSAEAVIQLWAKAQSPFRKFRQKAPVFNEQTTAPRTPSLARCVVISEPDACRFSPQSPRRWLAQDRRLPCPFVPPARNGS